MFRKGATRLRIEFQLLFMAPYFSVSADSKIASGGERTWPDRANRDLSFKNLFTHRHVTDLRIAHSSSARTEEDLHVASKAIPGERAWVTAHPHLIPMYSSTSSNSRCRAPDTQNIAPPPDRRIVVFVVAKLKLSGEDTETPTHPVP
jgi:hypothetical protein